GLRAAHEHRPEQRPGRQRRLVGVPARESGSAGVSQVPGSGTGFPADDPYGVRGAARPEDEHTRAEDTTPAEPAVRSFPAPADDVPDPAAAWPSAPGGAGAPGSPAPRTATPDTHDTPDSHDARAPYDSRDAKATTDPHATPDAHTTSDPHTPSDPHTTPDPYDTADPHTAPGAPAARADHAPAVADAASAVAEPAPAPADHASAPADHASTPADHASAPAVPAPAPEPAPSAPRLTDKGLPKRTPKVVAPREPVKKSSGGVDAEALRRRLGGFRQGALDGMRDAEAELAGHTGRESTGQTTGDAAGHTAARGVARGAEDASGRDGENRHRTGELDAGGTVEEERG
ncbi:hypothetical protein AB0C60_22085, partial [Streptomyces sp. NPDC048845]